jgi:hypothetical protein
MKDGAGDQVREEGDEEGVADEIEFHRLALVDVHQEGDLREGEEGYADGQRDVNRGRGTPDQAQDLGGEEPIVLEVGEDREVHRQPQDQDELPARFETGESQAEREVEDHRAQQQKNEFMGADIVEDQRHRREPARGEDPADRAEDEIH